MKIVNNLKFILAHLMRATRFYIVFLIARSVLMVFVKVMELYSAKIIIDYLMKTTSKFILLVIFYGVYLLLDYLCNQIQILIDNKVRSLKSIEISKYMRSLLYEKVKELDLSCYEDHAFLMIMNALSRKLIQE